MTSFRSILRWILAIHGIFGFGVPEGVFGWYSLVVNLFSLAMAWRMGFPSPFTRTLGLLLSGMYLPVNPWLAIGCFAAFWRRSAWTGQSAEPERRRVKGDGTSKWTDSIHLILDVALIWLGTAFTHAWARRNYLPESDTTSWLLAFEFALLLSVAVHELGHAIGGWISDFRLVDFQVGPFHWRLAESRWRFRFHIRGLIGGGATGMVPRSAGRIRDRAMFMIAGGPLASLLLGTVAGLMLALSPDAWWIEQWELLAITSVISTTAFITNLIPIAAGVAYSDGARLWQLYRGGPWANYLCATYYVGLSRCSQVLPREWPTGMIEGAADFSKALPEAPSILALAYVHFKDKGEIERADEYLRESMAACEKAGGDMKRYYAPEFAFHEAFHCRNPEQGRKWLAEAKADNSVDYLRALSAVLIAEGNVDFAREAWKKGSAMAANLPNAGAYEMDRHDFARLGARLVIAERMPA
ncbi:MAG: M50 family metallopeptidase [Bryobacteraceae bacterium]|nr:M50 family metallopeptidase [Bryobacteraceae bacterium]